jgi:predicted lipid-binding transport protein (Tim44 family)
VSGLWLALITVAVAAESSPVSEGGDLMGLGTLMALSPLVTLALGALGLAGRRRKMRKEDVFVGIVAAVNPVAGALAAAARDHGVSTTEKEAEARIAAHRSARFEALATVRAQPAHERLASLVHNDSAFSTVAFTELALELHDRLRRASGMGSWGPLEAYTVRSVRDELVRRYPHGPEASDVGRVEIVAYDPGRSWDTITVRFHEIVHPSHGVHRTVESWQFRRAVGAVSPPPAEAMRLGCPACHADSGPDADGQCHACRRQVTWGQLCWQLMDVGPTPQLQPIPMPDLDHPLVDPAVDRPTAVDMNLAVEMRKLRARHPDLDLAALGRNVDEVVTRIQTMEPALAAGVLSAPMRQRLAFVRGVFDAHGLVQRRDGLRAERREVCRARMDAWFESITVRVWIAGRRWVEDRAGVVAAGHPEQESRWSRVVTLSRPVGSLTWTVTDMDLGPAGQVIW